MFIRIRLKTKRNLNIPDYHTPALALAALLTPAALIAFSMALWSIASELRWTAQFAVSSGPFSHWQVWLGASAFLLLMSRLLNRYVVLGAVGSNQSKGSYPAS